MTDQKLYTIKQRIFQDDLKSFSICELLVCHYYEFVKQYKFPRMRGGRDRVLHTRKSFKLIFYLDPESDPVNKF